MEEIWRNIIGYEELYEVSNLGRVRSLNYRKTGEIRVLKLHYGKYTQIELSKNGIHSYPVVHKLVWEAFNGPVPDGYEINHLDENHHNNSLSNLALVTHTENINWGTRSTRAGEKISNVLRGRTNTKKPNRVEQYDLEGNYITDYYSPAEVERILNIPHQNVIKVCQGKRTIAGGYKWKYKKEQA